MKDIKFEVLKKIATTGFKVRNFENIKNLDSTSPPSVFIGSKLKYPAVNVGILSPFERDENAWLYDDVKYWANNNFDIKDIVNLRDNLINSRFQAKVKDVQTKNKFVEIAKQIATASNPVDIEIQLKTKLQFKRNKDQISTPQSLAAPLEKAKVIGNIKVERALDKVMNDEIKASTAIGDLYKKNFSEYVLSKILSVGVLGLKKNKKLVPTRWSITATDDTIGKKIIKEIKEYPWIESYELGFGEFMGNCYLIMLIPGVWSYELFELYLPGSSWNPSDEIKASTDWENYDGRKEYATATAGGYYASRLGVLEYLKKIKKQATVIAIRIETPTYWAALGVWVVRESVRRALSKKTLDFRSIEELEDSVKKVGMIKYAFDPSKILKQSKLLNSVNTQKRLSEWF